MTLYQQGISELRVGIGFGVSAQDYVFLLTDVSEWVRSVSITRGKTDDFQDFSAGTAQVVLDNRLRLFDPSNTLGPFYGQLKPRTRIEVQVTDYVVGTRSVFSGFIGGWPQTYDPNNNEATVTLPCYDFLALASQIEMPTDASKAVVMAYSDPYTRFFRLGDFTAFGDTVYDSANAANAYCQAGPGDGFTAANTVIVGPELADALNGTSTKFAGTIFTSPAKYVFVQTVQTLVSTERDIAFGGWLNVESNLVDYTGAASGLIKCGDFFLGLNGSGKVIVNNSSGTTLATGTTTLVGAGAHHIMCHYSASTNLVRIYYDGELDTASNTNLGNINSSDAIYFFSGFTEFYAQDWAFFIGGEVPTTWDTYAYPYFPRIFSGAGNNQAEMSTYQRYKLISRISGYDSTFWESLDPESAYKGTCLEFNISGKTLLQCLQDIARTEQSFLYSDRVGRLRFMGRYTVAESVLGYPQMIFTDNVPQLPTSRTDTAGNDFTGYMEFGYDYDDAQLANNVQVVIGSGDSASFEDNTSIASLGKKSHSIDTLLGDIPNAQTMAEGLTNIYKDPRLRLREMQIKPTNIYQAYWLSDMDIGDLIYTRRYPQNFGLPIVEALTVLQVRHEFTPQSWEMGIYASARPLNAFFILDHSSLDGPDILGF